MIKRAWAAETCWAANGVHIRHDILTIICLLGFPAEERRRDTLLLVQGSDYNFHASSGTPS